MSSESSESVLTSLPLLDELRTGELASNWTRQGGSNLDVLAEDPVDNLDRPLAICHLDVFIAFTQGDRRADQRAFEEASAVALAAHHLNVGDGSVVPQVKDLNRRCNIRFTVEFADTEYIPGVAVEHVLDVYSRQPGTAERLPCAFIGGYRSAVSIPTSILTGLWNYPQISPAATSADLDDKSQYPLFGRTIPSDHGNAVPIIQFMSQVWGISHLAILNVNDAYGNSFAQGLRLAAEVHAPEMKIHQSPVDSDMSSIRTALNDIKHTQYRYIFALIFTQETQDTILTEAYNLGIAGTGEHQWLFGDAFNRVNGRTFEENEPLNLAYRGVGMIEATGGIPDIGLERYGNYLDILSRVNNPTDLEYLFSLFPNYDDPEFQESVDNFENFLTPALGSYPTFIYEAAIALGLAACSLNPGGEGGEELFLDGQKHYVELVNSTFQGVNGDVVFDPVTGSRDPSYTLYKVSNFVDKPTSSGDVVRYEEAFTHIYQHGEWKEVNPFVFNDGSSTPPSDVPPVDFVDTVVTLPVRVSILLLFSVIVVLAVGCIAWTNKNRKKRVVLASQPFFLHTICIGVLVMASTIIPLSTDHGIAGPKGCTIACTSVPWLGAMGFSITISALFTKTHRVNMILNNANRLQRIKVTIWDVAKPMLFLLTLNTIILSVMSALAPSKYDIIVVNEDEFGRTQEIRGQCNFEDSLPYIASVSLLNFGALIFTLMQAVMARNLSTEFAESAQIFRALLSILMVVFVGGPVLLLARDNANAFVFVASAIIFVTSACILLLLFIPKIQVLKLARTKLPSRRIHISGIEMSERPSIRRASFLTDSSGGDTEEYTGMKILTTKTPQELVQEIDELKRLLRKAKLPREEDLGEERDSSQIFQSPPGRVKSILKKTSVNFISSIAEDSSDEGEKDIEKARDVLSSDKGSIGTLESIKEKPFPNRIVKEDDSSAVGSTDSRLDVLRERREAAIKKFDNLRIDSLESPMGRTKRLEISESDSSDKREATMKKIDSLRIDSP